MTDNDLADRGNMWLIKYQIATRECDELLPEINDYVLATKFHDGDPGDAWAVGYYAGMEGSRHMVKDSAGKQIRLNGYWRVGKIRIDVGTWLLSDAAKSLENSPPGTVNLWTMLTDASKEVKL